MGSDHKACKRVSTGREQRRGVPGGRLLAIFLPALMLGALSCRQGAAPRAAEPDLETHVTYQVGGIIREIKPEENTVVIQHDAIPDYMPAMTMPFRVRTTNELIDLQPADRVTFRMQVTPTESWIEQIRRIARPSPEELPSVQSFRRVREVEPLEVGEPMPDYRFTNELGRALQLSDFRGQAFAFTFIFTRCPLPEFCPRMSNHFLEVYKLLTTTAGAPTNWHLLTISFDPAFDTPAVLKSYAQRFRYEPNKWSFLTGALIDLDAITEQFGLWFSRRNGINWNHNLRTVVVGADGVIGKILIGNTWKPEELAEAILAAARPG